MPFLSQPGSLGLRTQATKGTYADPGAASPNQGVFIRYRSGSFEANRELLIPDPEIGGNRDIPDAALGAVAFSGEFDAYLRSEFLATVLRGALGAAASAGGATTGYTHTITPADTLPWVSVEENIGSTVSANAYERFRYTDAKVNTFHMEAEANGYLTGTFGLIALTQSAGNTPTPAANQRVDTSPLLIGTNITVTYNALTLPAKSFSLDINNNLEDDDFRLGSLTLGAITEKRRDITMGITIRPEDAALWKQAVYGSSGATAPVGGAAAKQQAVVTITSYEDIPGATAGVKYQTTITVPKAAIVPFSVSPSGDDVIEHDLELRALRPDPGVAILTAAVKNSYATVA